MKFLNGLSLGISIWCFILMNNSLKNEVYLWAFIQGVLGILNLGFAFI